MPLRLLFFIIVISPYGAVDFLLVMIARRRNYNEILGLLHYYPNLSMSLEKRLSWALEPAKDWMKDR